MDAWSEGEDIDNKIEIDGERCRCVSRTVFSKTTTACNDAVCVVCHSKLGRSKLKCNQCNCFLHSTCEKNMAKHWKTAQCPVCKFEGGKKRSSGLFDKETSHLRIGETIYSFAWPRGFTRHADSLSCKQVSRKLEKSKHNMLVIEFTDMGFMAHVIDARPFDNQQMLEDLCKTPLNEQWSYLLGMRIQNQIK